VFADRADANTPPRGQSETPAQGFRAALARPRVGLVLGGGGFPATAWASSAAPRGSP
jgi:hypothetical protein